ncbi:MAG: helix-turn-helix transcriptional regulator [Pseudomonadota bacterium]
MSKAPNPIDVHVGARVRLRRLNLGMSQEKLGEKLGLTFQQVQKYEKGSNRIGASRLYAISQILETPITYFFEGLERNVDEESGDEPSLSDFLATPEAIELNRSFARIQNTATRKRLTDLVKSVADDGAEG